MRNFTRLPNARSEGLVIRELEDETLVYDTERDEAHCLNRTAALVWELCDGKTSSSHAARQLQGTLGANIDSDVVWLAVRQLEKFHLVERAIKRPSVSRRDLVLKYAPAGLVLLPIIFSISAPEPVMAASCALTCQSCVSMPCCNPSDSCDGLCFPPSGCIG